MAIQVPDGSIISIGTTFGAAKSVTAITNANPGVATSAAHGLTNGALVIMQSTWPRLNNRIVRVAGSVASAFNLEGIDTTLTSLYPAGGGAGTATEVTAWTPISQITQFDTNGGDQKMADVSFLELDFDTQLPSTTSAMSINIGIADDPSLAGYQALKLASDTRAIRPLRVQMPNGSQLLYYGYVALNENPTLSKGNVMQVKAVFALQSRVTRY
jgi:hypothetical protein